MTLTLTTAGESHGPGLTTLVEGLPAGLLLDRDAMDRDMARRQLGFGRGGRMKIETDRAEVTAGVRHGRTLGGPIALQVANRDYANWEERMNPWPVEGATVQPVHMPRPGHADLNGAWKYGHDDVRNVLERASARETAARVAGGTLAKAFLRELGVEIRSHVTRIGTVPAPDPTAPLTVAAFEGVDDDPVRTLDADASRAMVKHITVERKANESIGGTYEVLVFGLLPGIGSHVSWQERLDGRLAQAICSIQAHKGVEFGDGFRLAETPGSQAQDEIFAGDDAEDGDQPTGALRRRTNHAGGLEGGMTTGQTLVIRAVVKPIPTITKPLRSVDLTTGEPAKALRERTDNCVVPAAGVVGEAMVAFVLASAYREKFGGDHIDDVKAAVDAYARRIGWTA
ncbi:MAG: chorismate synthase [Solirubrobacteraceae bacterium]|nr:chorismate synthase [Solirubrobacteraceae bacterium]